MSDEPRFADDYTNRLVDAARRVLVDVGQILDSFRESVVIVGGWVPDLLLPGQEPTHVGSIDLDLALDAGKLTDGRYAELLKLLLETGRYRQGEKDFQLVTDVDLKDGQPTVRVDVDFLAAKEMKLKGKNRVEGFRVFQFDACVVAFAEPREVKVEGRNSSGAQNSVLWRVVSLPDFLVLKSYALARRDKPKDAYDICYCLDHYPGGLEALASELNDRLKGDNAETVARALAHLREKFHSDDHYGPHQYAAFFGDKDEEKAASRQRVFRLVVSLLVNLELDLLALAAKLELTLEELKAIRIPLLTKELPNGELEPVAFHTAVQLEGQLRNKYQISREEYLGYGLQAAGVISQKQAEWLDEIKRSLQEE
jgi:hypothetical protein